MSSWEESLGYTRDTLERLSLSCPGNASAFPREAEESGREEGRLHFSA